MSTPEKRIERAEDAMRSNEERLTIDVQFHETTIDANGVRRRVPIPATYDEGAPFDEDRMRVRYPLPDRESQEDDHPDRCK